MQPVLHRRIYFGGVAFLHFFGRARLLYLLCDLLSLSNGVHRARTFVLAFYKPTAEKTFVFLSMAVLLLCSCWDCHLFNIGPGIIYSVLLLFLEKSEECGRNFAAPLPQRKKARRTDGDAA